MAAIAQGSILLVVLIIAAVEGRVLRLYSSDHNHEHLILDGVDSLANQTRYNNNNALSIPSTTCDHQYGFLPCAENAAGFVFQIMVYQGLLIFGEKQIGSGSKVLFNIMGVVSGVFSSKENAQSQVSVGIGIYAGITVFSLTVHWGICVIFGRKGLKDNNKSNENAQTSISSNCLPAKEKLIILKDTGVEIDQHTRYTAGIMLLSLIPYIIVQLEDFILTSSGDRIVTLIALTVSALSLFSYFAYQVLYPWMQQRSLDYSKYEILRTGFLKHVQRQGKLVTEDGKLNISLIQKLFDDVDKDNNQRIGKAELESLVLDIIKTGKVTIDEEFALSQVMETFDFDADDSINIDEFTQGCKKWIEENKKPSGGSSTDSTSGSVFHELFELFKERKHDDAQKTILWQQAVHNKWALFKSIFQLLLGIVMLTFLGGPLMGSILQLSYAMGFPSFSISFVIVPFAMNARAVLAAIFPASQKSTLTASLTFSEIYGGVIMNNIAGLTTLLAIVYAKDLTWDFSAEVLTILVVCAIVGMLAYSSTTYPLWTCILAFFLYPFSLGMFYFVQVFLSWN
ncbi:sodium/calcium exchanger family protein / calcium-binding EF hand family protein [Striga hermonthica]|uniref:Sodium/calcium exchanger family protein / calcium-binding EF hand family protein n=1 Tax=Striga hermonthica TaxID=68872 RepID=A0A9N7N108_STRHE|nr:sodium/calcium exchanger family protein / calcium-binding EF hand family protein [Striga hermonthica]